MRFIIDTPWYWFVCCLLVGALFAAALYFIDFRKNSKSPINGFSPRVRWILTALRFLAVSALCFLFLAPLAKHSSNRQEKPIILMLNDNSQSIVLSRDSAFYRSDYADSYRHLVSQLSADYDVQLYSFGSALQGPLDKFAPNYSEQTTSIAEPLQSLAATFKDRNVGALVLASDGICNQGLNPVTVAENLTFPVYTIALGDTALRRDAAIADVRFNRIAYLGNQFPLEVTVHATQLSGSHAKLSVSSNGRTLFSKDLNYASTDFSQTETFVIDADKPGVQTYQISLSTVANESSSKNNVRSVAVEVIDGHQKVAIVAAAPHPDISALKQAIEFNQNYEVSTFLAKDFKAKADDYDLLILHNLPSRNIAFDLPADVPVIFVIGCQTDLARFNALHTGLEINTRIAKTNESEPLFNSQFSHFSLSDPTWQAVEQFPPLTSPFGDYRSASNTQTLFSAKIGSLSSGVPLVAFGQQGSRRCGFIAGEGIWKWRLADYQSSGSHDHFNELVSKIVSFSALRIDKDQFRVNAQHIYRLGEQVIVEAQLYNDNFELTNRPDASFTLSSASGKPHQYQFNRTASAYTLNLGSLPAGQYSYSAATALGGKKLTAKGSFVVEDLHLEDVNLVADHSLLNTLAQTTGGEMLSPSDLSKLPQLLKERSDIKSVIYTQTRYTEFLNLPLVFLLILLLLGSEWIIRKYNGEI